MSIFRRRIRSALYIDYENVPLNADQIGNVVAWLEDGMFEEPRRKRALIERRVYWNSQAHRYRNTFESHAFEVVLIEKYGGLKNGADIRIAMDMVEATFKRPRIEEFILISRDSDFVPVIQRLGDKDKSAIMLVEEQQPAAYTAYSLHADGIITRRALQQEAQVYQRPRRGLLDRIGVRRRPSATAPVARRPASPARAAITPPPAAAAPPAHVNGAVAAAAPAPATVSKQSEPLTGERQELEAAVAAFLRVASRNPDKLTGKASIIKQLKTIKTFTNTGSRPYLGFKSYEALAKKVAVRDPRITIQSDRLGGIAVVYVPGDTDSEAEHAAATVTVPASTAAPADASQPAPQPPVRDKPDHPAQPDSSDAASPVSPAPRTQEHPAS